MILIHKDLLLLIFMYFNEIELNALIISIIRRMDDVWGNGGIATDNATVTSLFSDFDDLTEEYHATFSHLPAFIPDLDLILQSCLYAFISHNNIQLPAPPLQSPNDTHKDIIAAKLTHLCNIPQPEQRTPEWYRFRYDLITASNAYKALATPGIRNSLIYEKCKPLVIDDAAPSTNFVGMINTSSPMHWGQKFEPLSVMLYERIYKTHVGTFGCIRHPNPAYSFIGASPDGINDDPESPLYGRMLEIKNVVSRTITGIPKREYAVQMQMQMEVCDLDDCDFLETKFVEYENPEQFYADVALKTTAPTMRTIQGQTIPQYYGMMLQFRQLNIDTPFYKYRIWEHGYDTREDFEQFEQDIIVDEHRASDVNEYGERYTQWLHTIYWKLDVFSCLYYTRDRAWFDLNAPQFTALWDTVLKERIQGYEHRAPVRRNTTTTTTTTTANETTKEINFIDEGAPSSKWGASKSKKYIPQDYSVCLFGNNDTESYEFNKVG